MRRTQGEQEIITNGENLWTGVFMDSHASNVTEETLILIF